MGGIVKLNLLSVLMTCGMYLNNIWSRFLGVLGFVWFVFDFYDCTLFCTYDIM